MISLTIDRSTASTPMMPLTITDTGTSGFVLAALDPGSVERDNAYARSRWLDGARLVSTRTELSSLSAVVQVWGSSPSDLQTKIAELGDAVNLFGYTITVTYSDGSSTAYTALPASYDVAYDPNLLRSNMAVVSLSIPVQP